MKIEVAIEYFGGVHSLADACKIRPQNVYVWRSTHSGLVPLRHAHFLSQLTEGKLAVEPDDYMTPVQKKLLKAKGKK